MEINLTKSYEEYLEKLKHWVRSSLEFTILGIAPSEDDLVFLNELPPSLKLTTNPPENEFVTLGEMVRLCEDAATNKMIYEAFLDSALDNAYCAKSALNIYDGSRLIAFFKAYYSIGDEGELESEAKNAIKEAQQMLYGDEDELEAEAEDVIKEVPQRLIVLDDDWPECPF